MEAGMVSIAPIRKGNTREKIAAAANKVAENLIQESKNKNFDIRNFARKRGYDLTSAKLNGIILGEKGASLKIMSGVYERSIFAIMKDGKILWAKGYALGRHYLKLTLEKLCQKGKISEDELTFAKKQIHL